MAVMESGQHPRREQPPVANGGRLRPPIIYLCSIAAGVLIHLIRPVRLFSSRIHIPLGILLAAAAVWLFKSAARAFGKAGTPVPGNRPSTTLVRGGPYRISRNPIYIAFTLFQVAMAIGLNSLALLITVLPAFALIALVIVPREERYLEARFPVDYPTYKCAVRRWM